MAGKNNIAVDVLEYLVKNNGARYDLGVVCNKTETGINSWQKSLRFFAKKFGVAEYELEDIYNKDSLIFLSLEFDQIIKPELFQNAKLYNIHFSLLPKYKGMYTSAIPILNGEKKVGVTFHKIDNGIDTGDIIKQKSIKIDEHDTCRELYFKYINEGTKLVLEQIEYVLQDAIKAYPQNNKNSTYYSKKYINYGDLKIDLQQTACGIQRQIRAFSFREYQLPTVFGEKIVDSKITNIKSTKKPGVILEKNEYALMISTVDYNIVLYVDRFDELLHACEKGKLDVVKDICGIKAHINATNQRGWTPLMVATYNNQKEVVDYLLLNGADIYRTNYNGTTILMYAKEAYLRYGDATLFEKFYSLGMDVSTRDYSGKDVEEYLNEDGYELKDILS